jgi:hypothetical protein
MLLKDEMVGLENRSSPLSQQRKEHPLSGETLEKSEEQNKGFWQSSSPLNTSKGAGFGYTHFQLEIFDFQLWLVILTRRCKL